MSASNSVTAKAADVFGQCRERMFHAGLTNLFKAFVVRGATAHSIDILRNHRVVVVWRLKPVQVDGSGIARVGSHGEPDLRSGRAVSG